MIRASTFACGIGLTVSLFLGALGLADAPQLAAEAKMGVLLGSALSGIIGVALLLVVRSQSG